MKFDRKVFFDSIRESLYRGSIREQATIDGLNYKLDYFETLPDDTDLRWLANALGQWHHETGARMYPVRETFATSDAQARQRLAGAPYAQTDPVTGEAYYGRGDIQLTWKENYQKQQDKHGFPLVNDPESQLKPEVSVVTSYHGMVDGDFRGDARGRQTLARYFSDAVNDPYGAREIVNGDKHRKPSWAGGRSIGQLCVGYHNAYLDALTRSLVVGPVEPPEPSPPPDCPPVEEVLKEATTEQLLEELKTRGFVPSVVLTKRL